ncbi:hypothetical protein COK37_23715 [Bacillus thuringiensis]|uniref:hypothetical protein n=1 Tax=Bacillus thuringiensis TaxID=1428 RepID=UPI000BF9C58F|nr:hypothetical protein [Bacillus thuringiensis]PEV49007.1 hypothetical protein CN432_12670 [Bacillus thuringiensis]PFR65346.1 hypothetical protein COK37_23715 [Bacillus thuringiensis]PFT78327.1 hypothetical protein COK70_17940 [Bacillus thuringiensis]PFV92689.1 hypothetical protein COL06_02400 [Bacillus thuringiensis]
MNEKNYSIAAPSLFINEKNHIISVSPSLSYEKTYCVSISIANPFGENVHEFPVSMPPNSRFKAVKEDNAGVFATRVNKIKGVFSDVINQASRDIEVEASITTLNAFDIDRNVNIDISEMENLTQSRCFAIDITANESAQQRSRIFDMDHLKEELADKPFDTREITIANESIMSRTTDEYEMNESIEELLHKKIREFATEVEELPEWVKVARVLYGEKFYESILVDRREKELQSSMSESDTAGNIIKELPAVTTHPLEMADRCIYEVAASYEEYDLFNDLGIPVYLPDYDLFARIQRELKADYTKFDTADRNIIQVDGGSISFELAEREQIEAITAVATDETSIRKNLSLKLETFDMEDSKRIKKEVIASSARYEQANKIHSCHESEIEDETQSIRVTNELTGNSIEVLESMDNKGRELAIDVVDTASDFVLTRDLIAENIIEFDNATRKNELIHTILDNETNAHKVIPEITANFIESRQFNRKSKNIHSYITTDELSTRKTKQIDVVEVESSTADRSILELEAQNEEMDLFEGMGLPVYLPDYDLFARVKRELQTTTVLSDIMDRSKVTITSEIVDIIDMERCKQNIMTDVSGIIDFERPVLELDSQIANDYDAADTPAKQSLILELDTFDRDVSVATDIEEFERFNRDTCIESSVAEFEPAEKVLGINTEIIESERFIINKLIDTECIQFDDFIINNIYPTEIIEGDENRKVQKEEPKLWLRHSRSSWWTNSNWKKTR